MRLVASCSCGVSSHVHSPSHAPDSCSTAQMYAWSVASAQLEGGPLDYQLKERFMLQPPFDMGLNRVR